MAMRFRVNPFHERGTLPAAAPSEVRVFHASLPGFAATPLHNCSALAAALGIGALYVKDEGARFGLGAFKGLGASWAVERIRRRGGDPLTLASATEGNHGRAVAWAARLLGRPAVIFIPAHAAPARIEHIRREGARVELVEGNYDAAVARCAAESARQGWQVVSDAGYEDDCEIPQWIAEGYATLFEEAEQQREAGRFAPPDVVLIQAGVGALLHAAVNHFRARPRPPVVVAVEPVAADAGIRSIESPEGTPTASSGRQDSIMVGLNCGRVSLSAWPVVRRGVELFITVTDTYAERAMRLLATPASGDPAIVAGATGAAGLAGLLALIDAPELSGARAYLDLGNGSRVMVVVTEGAMDPEEYGRVVGYRPHAPQQTTINQNRRASADSR
jgi:diaminopropionate ammonia-lyase